MKVQWTEAAKLDVKDIFRYIARDSPVSAARVLKRLRNRAATLSSHAARGRVVPELAELGVTNYRELVIEPYRLMYRIERTVVRVHVVLDGRRDVRRVLAERLARPDETSPPKKPKKR